MIPMEQKRIGISYGTRKLLYKLCKVLFGELFIHIAAIPGGKNKARDFMMACLFSFFPSNS